MDVLEVHPFESSIVVLGMTALFFNAVYVIYILIKVSTITSGIWKYWMLYVNLFLFLLQLLFWFY